MTDTEGGVKVGCGFEGAGRWGVGGGGAMAGIGGVVVVVGAPARERTIRV